MRNAIKIALGAIALAVVAFVAVRLGGSHAAKGGLDMALANLPPGYAATHGAVTYDALGGDARLKDLVVTYHGGPFFSAGAVIASGISGATPTSPPTRIGHVEIKDISAPLYPHVGTLTVDGLNIGNIRTLIDPGAYPNGKPASTSRLPLTESIDLTDVQVHVDVPPGAAMPNTPAIKAVDAHLSHFHADSISARQFAAPPTAASLHDMAFLADAARGIAEQGVTAKGLTETVAGTASVSVGSETVSQLQDGRIAAIELHDIVVTTPRAAGRFALDTISASDIDLNRFLDLLPAMQTDPTGTAAKLNGALRVGGFTMAGATADFAHAPLITLGSFHGNTEYHIDGRQAGSAQMHALKVITTGRETKPEVAEQLQRFGMADFAIDLDEAGTYSPADGHLKLDHADFTFAGLGALHIAMDVAGLNNPGGTDAANQMAMLRQIQLYNATLRWDDASLTNRIFHAVALQTGRPEEALRASLAIPLATLSMFMPNQPDAGTQINAFLADPKQLTITLAPPSPVNLGDVATAPVQEKAQLLGVTIKGN